jgi:hypothetical protein
MTITIITNVSSALKSCVLYLLAILFIVLLFIINPEGNTFEVSSVNGTHNLQLQQYAAIPVK